MITRMLSSLTIAAVLFAGTADALSQAPPPPPPPGGGAALNETALQTNGSQSLTGEVWVDNWFALWLNGEKLIEDSVPITTERSFNAERFTFRADPPYTFAFEFRDFMENETGLEYIGTRRQQMGDGGAIAQFSDADGHIVAVTDENWRCLVVQHAPVGGQACERARNPTVGEGDCAARTTAISDGWTAPDFDDNAWASATVHSQRAVGPKDGYDAIAWNPSAKLIWGKDLERDNVILCRLTVSTGE
ncbi:PEBP family protein [Oricola sp.]|uniref:PEBP family protein n=1 Tax=Oricola sp. TaxID=1979950 RepID=UPI0025DAE924|nr:PEBP family protein [Oricola sp.]MCI5077835.1 PEBP family protein [Oricola sp.]